MTYDERIESVARVIDPVAWTDAYPQMATVQNVYDSRRFLSGERRRKKAMKQARAADRATLLGIREPTLEAVDAGLEGRTLGQTWRAMIDKLLEDA